MIDPRNTARARAGLLLLALAAQGCSDDPAPRSTAPPDDHGDDDHGSTVELTEAQVESAGIRVVTAAPGELVRRLALPAVVAVNADAVTHVNPKAPGIVRSIEKQLGDGVAPGDLLCVIDSVELGGAVAEFVRARALVEAAEETLERESALFGERIATATRVLDGAIAVERRILEREKELQAKAVSTIRPLLEAERALQGAELDKDRQLTDLRADREGRLLALEVELRERRILAEAARNHLLALGVGADALAELEPGSGLLAGAYEIRAPRGGVVAARHISAGEFVDAQTKLYTLHDLSRVWVLASAFEKEIRAVRTGQAGEIRLDAFPETVFEGRVTLVGYEVDPESRALGVRLELENPTLADWPEEHPLRPGMFGSVALVVERGHARVIVPESAIVHEQEGDAVFVRVAPRTFERRAVTVGGASGESVEVTAGVEPGEEVAVAGTFLLKSVLREGELGEGHDH